MKKLISLILLLTLITLTFSMIGCVSEIPANSLASGNNEKGEINEDKGQENQKDEKVYESIVFSGEGFLQRSFRLPSETPTLIVKSVDELLALNPKNLHNFNDKYTSDFFVTKALVIAQFYHDSMTDFIELSGIVEKGGKLCPVITISRGFMTVDDIVTSVVYAEISRDDIGEIGNLNVINIHEDDVIICDYEVFDGKIVKKEN
ncbi:MAG: hypothetical protein E7633_05720 [Ruminococcaceae bacterium]|nr:hypothetical protein [Oscillospiraceae bacterium]